VEASTKKRRNKMSDLLDFQDAAAARDMAQFNERHPASPEVPTRLLDNLRKAKTAIRKASNEIKLMDPPEKVRSELYSKILEAAKIDMAEHMQAEREVWTEKLAKEAQAWERDRRLNAAKYQAENAQKAMRYEAMTPDEIKVEAHKLMQNPKPVDGYVLDALSIQLKKVDPEEHSKFRGFVKDSAAYEPWKHTEQGQVITRYMKALDDGMKAGGSALPILHADGAIHFEDLSTVLGGRL
jgi:hypothetical protein